MKVYEKEEEQRLMEEEERAEEKEKTAKEAGVTVYTIGPPPDLVPGGGGRGTGNASRFGLGGQMTNNVSGFGPGSYTNLFPQR